MRISESMKASKKGLAWISKSLLHPLYTSWLHNTHIYRFLALLHHIDDNILAILIQKQYESQE